MIKLVRRFIIDFIKPAFLVFLSALVVLCGSLAAEAASRDEILRSVQKRFTGLKTLSADYMRITNSPSVEGIFKTTTKHTASGVLFFQKTGQTQPQSVHASSREVGHRRSNRLVVYA